MEKLSISEFKNCCDEIQPHAYRFSTSNQHGIKLNWNINFTATYNNLIVCLFPNMVVFQGGDGALTLKNVKYILHQDFGQIGHIFDFVCEDTDDYADVYRVMAI